MLHCTEVSQLMSPVSQQGRKHVSVKAFGEGQIKYREDVVDGFKSAPRAIIGLLRGENFGKLLVRIAHAS
jgi:NADPH-dependent curcumin reductase CurA